MTSPHVTCHVTVVSHASSSSKRKIKEKRKENQYKIRKIKEKKNKIVSVQASYNKHGLNSLINNHHSKKAKSHCLSMSKIIDKQQYKIKSLIVDSNN